MAPLRGKLPLHITNAERAVLQLLSQARTNKEIAASLGISPATVKRHLENILRKLNLRNRVQAAIYALMLGGCPQSLVERDCPLNARRAQEDKQNGDGPFG